MPSGSQPRNPGSLVEGKNASLVLAKVSIETLARVPAPFSAIEIEAPIYLSWDGNLRKRFRTVLKQQGLKVILRIRLNPRQIEEETRDSVMTICEELGASLEFLSFHAGRKRVDQIQSPGAIRGLSQLSIELQKPLFFEWGEEDTVLTTNELRSRYSHLGMLMDPHQHGRFVSKIEGPVHFKLHGWHPERWMRRYGETLGRKLVKKIKTRPGALLILAHSGRFDEAQDFERWIRE